MTAFAKSPKTFSIWIGSLNQEQCQIRLEPIREKIKNQFKLSNLIGEYVQESDTGDYGFTSYFSKLRL